MRIILALLLGFSLALQGLTAENPLPSALNVYGITKEYIQTLRRVDDEAAKIAKLNRQQLSKRMSAAEAEIEQLEQDVLTLRNDVKDIERRIKESPSTADALDKANKRLAKLALRGFREIPNAVGSNTEKKAKISISMATELTQAYADQLEAIEKDEILRDLQDKLAAKKSALDQSELSLYRAVFAFVIASQLSETGASPLGNSILGARKSLDKLVPQINQGQPSLDGPQRRGGPANNTREN